MTKQVIRTIHHLSCTGGTLISKCIASMPNIALISETHPFGVGALRFNPFDPVQQLFSQNLLNDKEDALKHVFKSRVQMAYNLCTLNGKLLILRDHTHSDYLAGKEPQGFRLKSVVNCLKYEFDIKSVVTLRNPVDTFLSLEKNGWSKDVKTFDEYCRRIVLMINAYQGVPIYHYEEFCRDPDTVLKNICKDLDIPFDQNYTSMFFTKTLTGDSGRGKEITEIVPLPRREHNKQYLELVGSSSHFQVLRELFGYEVE